MWPGVCSRVSSRDDGWEVDESSGRRARRPLPGSPAALSRPTAEPIQSKRLSSSPHPVRRLLAEIVLHAQSRYHASGPVILHARSSGIWSIGWCSVTGTGQTVFSHLDHRGLPTAKSSLPGCIYSVRLHGRATLREPETLGNESWPIVRTKRTMPGCLASILNSTEPCK